MWNEDVLERVYNQISRSTSHFGTAQARLRRCCGVSRHWRQKMLHWDEKRDEEPLKLEYVALKDIIGAVNKALNTGRTPLIIDRTVDHNVDIFYGYGGGMAGPGSVVLKMKPLVLRQTRGKDPMKDIMEAAREPLVSAMKHGKPLVVMLENSAPDFRNVFHDEADWNDAGRTYFPTEVFRCGGHEVMTGHWPDSLWRPREREHGYALPKKGFHVILTSHFKPELIDNYLFGTGKGPGRGRGLPLPKHQFHAICVEDDTIPDGAPASGAISLQRPDTADQDSTGVRASYGLAAIELLRKYEKEGIAWGSEQERQWREGRRAEISSDERVDGYRSTALERR